MSVGRNDPCPCGSGKKYKKCCLSKDEAARPAYVPAPAPQGASASSGRDWPEGTALEPPRPPRKLTADEQAAQDSWTAFEAADFDGKVALFEQALAGPAMGVDDSFEMLNVLMSEAESAEKLERALHLIGLLRDRRPGAYAVDEGAYVSWQIKGALIGAGSRDSSVVPLAIRMGELAGAQIDTFNRVYAQLSWHGRLDALAPALRAGWAGVRESKDIFAWAINEYAAKAADTIILDWLERRPDARAVDDELREAVAPFSAGATQMDAYVATMGGWDDRKWDLSEFEFLARPPESKPDGAVRDEFDDAEEDNDDEGLDDEDVEAAAEDDATEEPDPDIKRLFDLGVAFVAYARTREGIPSTRANMFRRNIVQYLLDRHAGELEPRESMLQAMSRPSGKPAPKRKPPVPAHVLCPDRKSLEQFLVDRLRPLSMQVYEAVVTLEIVPAWLRFLASLGLLTDERQAATLHELRKLSEELLKVLKDHDDDALFRAIEQWSALPRG